MSVNAASRVVPPALASLALLLSRVAGCHSDAVHQHRWPSAWPGPGGDCSAGECCNSYTAAAPSPADNHCPGVTVCSASREPANLAAFLVWSCISVPWPCTIDLDCGGNQVCTAGRCTTPRALPAQPALRLRAPSVARSLVR
jgi:hypothetical protein